jgi:hypothetical protein
MKCAKWLLWVATHKLPLHILRLLLCQLHHKYILAKVVADFGSSENEEGVLLVIISFNFC